jgi:aminocarboxymuconate-semialdehyde decarboxylase
MKGVKVGPQVPTIERQYFSKQGGSGGASMTTGPMARGGSAKNRASEPVSIDMHTHWAPEAYNKAMARLRRPGRASPNPLTFDLDKRRKWMDEHGVKMHVLTLSGSMPWHWVPQDVGATLAQIINDANIEAHTAFPDRFVGSIEVSIRDPELALKELNRVAGKPGMQTVHLPTSIEGKDYLFEERYQPFLARCEKLGYPLMFHPLDSSGWGENIHGGGEQSRLATPLARAANINNTLGFPFEYATVATKFIITGTLDKYPKLDIVWPHMGGIFPYIAARIHRGLWMNKFKLQHPFRDYVRRFHYDTLAYYPETMRFLINLVGSDRVVIGTDNFAIMDVEWPNALVEQMNLPTADRDKILWGNAARLLRL